MSVRTETYGIGPTGGIKFLKVMLLTGIPFGLFMGIFWALLYGSRIGVVMGSVAGLLFGAVIGAFVGHQKKKFETERPSFAGEDLVKEGGANHFRSIEAVGGWMYLTDRRLLFRSHSLNVQRHELSIPLETISEAKPRMTFGIIPNGLEVKTIDGNTEKFVVEDRKGWVKKILEAKERGSVPSR
jgi:hypothetical protein